jgi:integrase
VRGKGDRAHGPEAKVQTAVDPDDLAFAGPRSFKVVCSSELGSAASKRTYGAAIEDFITWYCSEPRLVLGRTVVLRYRYELEARRLAPATINLRLAAVRRLAYEASDNGLLNPDLAAGIRRVKGAKRLGMRLGNWLTADQGRKLLAVPSGCSIREKRDYAILSLLLGCGLRRAELTGLTLGHLQQRDEHWAIVNLYGKGGHIRTVPVPFWVKMALDRWLIAAEMNDGAIFRRVHRTGTVWVRESARSSSGGLLGKALSWPESTDWPRTTCDVRVLGSVTQPEASLSRFSFSSDIGPSRLRNDTWGHGSGSSLP